MNLRFNGHNDDECDNSISSQNALHSIYASNGSNGKNGNNGNNGISSTLPQQTRMKIKTSLTSLSATIANSCYLASVSPEISDSGTCLIKKSYKRKSQKWYACDQVSGREHLLNSTIDCESLQNVVKYTRINSKNFCTYFLVTLVILSCCPLASVLAILHNNNYDGISQPVNALEREYEKTAKATTTTNTANATTTTTTTTTTATTTTSTTNITTNRSTTIKAIHNNTNATTISQSVNNNEVKRNGSTNSSSKNSSSVSSNYSNNDQHISNNIWNGLNTKNTGISRRTSKNITTAVKLILNDYSEAFSQIINEELELQQQQQSHEPSFHNNITRRKTNNNNNNSSNKNKNSSNSSINHNNRSNNNKSSYNSSNSRIKFGTDTGNSQNLQSNVSENYDVDDDFNLHDELLDSFCSSHSLPHKPYYTNEFAVHIPAGHDMANIIAQKYGFANMGQRMVFALKAK
uniref:Peptidase S8 pro-domain domain-containing protein n=1 Tax=Glossina brevipalpis TaxID=37001 RepID=A0A1A9W1F8_9MUSC